jgi:hypothetical protein
MYGKAGDTEMQARKQRRCRLVLSLLFISETSQDMQVRAVGIKMFLILIFLYSSGFQPAACEPMESDWVKLFEAVCESTSTEVIVTLNSLSATKIRSVNNEFLVEG